MSHTQPRLMLHLCCAPCGTHVIELLRTQFDLICYFYNPNIQPEAEYLKRLADARGYAKRQGVEFIEGDYDVQEWFEAVKGLESEPEGGKRCEICYRKRFQRTAETAIERGCEYFTTTLTISPRKKSGVINRIGVEVAEQFQHLTFYEADFKKRNGFKKSVEISRRAGLYRQNYCGCVFSQRHGSRGARS